MRTKRLPKKVMLLILDGIGSAPNSRGNAVTIAQPKNLIRYWDTYPHTYLHASEESVGLPEGVAGNSEVGHMNIGSGRVVYQSLPKINKTITTGAFFSNQTLINAVKRATDQGGNIHIMGCLSDGGVHSHINHFIAVLEYLTKVAFANKAYIHAFTDGRDTPPKSADEFLTKMQGAIDKYGIGHIASLCGRAFAMDRNQKWDRTEKAYNLLTQGKGDRFSSWQDALNNAYIKEQIDEYIEPSIITDNDELPVITEKDSVFFMNYRADRATQLSEAFASPDFTNFQQEKVVNPFFVGMGQYKKNFPTNVLFPKEYIKLSLGRLISEQDIKQLRIAESEKFPHVTYFFNGGIPIIYNGEDRIEIPSPNVTTYDQKPEMSIMELSNTLEQKILSDIYDFIVVNIANPDMVAHTGNIDATVKAIEATDYVVERLVSRFVAKGGSVIITADHGNSEEIINLDTGDVDTEHSINPVPFIIVDKELPKQRLRLGKLADIAPTVLDLMGFKEPVEMVGDTLLP